MLYVSPHGLRNFSILLYC